MDGSLYRKRMMVVFDNGRMGAIAESGVGRLPERASVAVLHPAAS
jgi:hypothetical protein